MSIDISNSLHTTQNQTLTISQQMIESLHVLSMDIGELTSYLYKQQEDNPLLEITEYPHANFASTIMPAGKGGAPFDTDETMFPDIPAKTSFREALILELDVCSLSWKALAAAELIISDLDDSGFFTSSLEDIARLSNVTVDDAAQGLAAVQALDPAGIGARDIEECLCLQLKRCGETSSLAYEIIKHCLKDAAARKYSKIADELHTSEESVRKCCKQISALHPRPILQDTDIEYVVPDIIVITNGDSLEIQFNDGCLPKLVTNDSYLRYVNMDKACKDYLAGYKASANQVIKDVEMRRSTIVDVTKMIVLTQQDFFKHNMPLVPLSLKDISEQLGLHQSTISKAISKKHIHCEQGTFLMKHFLARKIEYAHADISTDRIRNSIKKMLSEDPSLTDSKIADRLAQMDMSIARRTVAKYRLEMGLKTSFGKSSK